MDIATSLMDDSATPTNCYRPPGIEFDKRKSFCHDLILILVLGVFPAAAFIHSWHNTILPVGTPQDDAMILASPDDY